MLRRLGGVNQFSGIYKYVNGFFDQQGVKLRASTKFDFFNGFWNSFSHLIDTICGHCVKGICDAHNPRKKRDIFTA